jgi:RNA polymerase sigma-70 factor (sigma-E family)
VKAEPAVSFEDYVRLRYGDLRRLAFLLCGDWAAADDGVQTALIACEKRWLSIHDPQRHAYVRQAVIRTMSTWRLRRRAHAPLAELDATAAVETDVDARLTVLAALQLLPVGQRQVVVLRFYEGLSEREIADALGIGLGTVKSRASRAMAALRESDLRVLVGGGAA